MTDLWVKSSEGWVKLDPREQFVRLDGRWEKAGELTDSEWESLLAHYGSDEAGYQLRAIREAIVSQQEAEQ